MAEQESVTVLTKGNSFIGGMLSSRTFWINIAALLAMVLAEPQLVAVLPPEWMPYIVAVAALANVVNRAFTTAPITGSRGATNAQG